MRILARYTESIFFAALLTGGLLHAPTANTMSNDNDNAERAILIEGSGVYHRTISTSNTLAQQFFDQGLRYAWGFYFPESIASYQQATMHDPEHPMIYWGLAHAMGPNPNSRYSGMPDDPKARGLKSHQKSVKLNQKSLTD